VSETSRQAGTGAEEPVEGPNEVMEAIATPPSPTLTVAAVARRLGVAPPTLRTWDRRYGLGPSAHTAGAHRRYSPADVARLMVMRRLTLEGVAPSDAAKIALATALTPEGRPVQSEDDHTPAEGYDASSLGSSGSSFETGRPAEPVRPVIAPDEDRYPPGSFLDEVEADGALPNQGSQARSAETGLDEGDFVESFGREEPTAWSAGSAYRLTEERTPADDLDLDLDGFDNAAPGEDDDWPGVLRSVETSRGGPSGGGRVVALPDGTPQSRGLARAAMSLDSFETHRLLKESIRRQGVVPTWNTMIMPVLRGLGERVRISGEGIDVEHAFSEAILGVLRNAAVNVRITRNSPMVLLACADSDYHSLPLHALAAALAEHEVPTRMLGSGLPPHALASSVRRTGPSVIVLFARMPGADAGDAQVLRRQRPAPTVILAGPGWRPDTIPASARTAGSLIEAIDEVLRGLQN
jgi:MerR family transcriptional regulator, light-induced transcriptional regulator